ncbi:hypothetical protein N9L19_01295 [bacterium]|nr:hypothetical protein [bacterium]
MEEIGKEPERSGDTAARSWEEDLEILASEKEMSEFTKVVVSFRGVGCCSGR